jgi:hypothetical protein
MGDVTSGCTIELIGELGGTDKKLRIKTAATVDTADTIEITLSDYDCTAIENILGWVHTTEDSVVVVEDPTTAVSGGDLTITVGGSAASNKKRVYEVVLS